MEVDMNKGTKLLLVLSVAFMFAGCDNLPFSKKAAKVSSPESKMPVGVDIVAKVGNMYITADDLNKEVDTYNAILANQAMAQNKIDSKAKRVEYLRNELVRKYMLYQAALDKGLDKNKDIQALQEYNKRTILVEALLREELAKVEVDSKEIEDFYNQNKDALRDPDQRKISEIVCSTEEEAKQVYIELLKGGDFAVLAKQYSKGKTASSGGDLGFIALDPDAAKRIRNDKFYEVAFAPSFEAGTISNIFKCPDGYYIIRLDSIKKSETKSLSSLSDKIKTYLLFDKQNKAIAELGNKLAGETKVEIYEGKVE